MLTIGETPYVSTLPVYLPLRKVYEADYVSGGLTELSERLLAGGLDAGPLSVVDYLRHRDRFEAIPGVALSSWGRAGCGVLFSRKPIVSPEALEIAIPTRTAGTVYLLRWLMSEMFGVEPKLVERTAPLSELLDEYDAALLFEDIALQATAESHSDIEVWDLGEAWWQITNTPLLYTVWVMRKGLPEAEKQAIAHAFSEAKAQAGALREAVVEEAHRRTGLPQPMLGAFLERFNYDFSPSHQQGLSLFETTVCKLS